MKRNLAVLVSGRGTNLQAIIDAVREKRLNANIKVVVSSRDDAYAICRARKANIPVVVIKPSDFPSRQEFDRKLISVMEENKVDLIVLAGFMLLLGKEFVEKFRNRIINLHPSLLPSFKGTHGIEDAYNYGVKVTGVTVHFVDEELDHGPIIIQKPVIIKEGMSLEELEAKIHEVEHEAIVEAISLYLDGRLEVVGRRVRVKSPEFASPEEQAEKLSFP